jgi:hypothetical protein
LRRNKKRTKFGSIQVRGEAMIEYLQTGMAGYRLLAQGFAGLRCGRPVRGSARTGNLLRRTEIR